MGNSCSSCIGNCLGLRLENFDRLDDQGSMGAGVVKPQPDGRGGIRIHINPGNLNSAPPFGSSTSQRNRPQPKPESTSCEECSQAFSPFRKKKPCKDCGRNFCSNCCVNTGSSSPRLAQCKKCQILLTGTFSRSLLADWKIKDLKALLVKQNVNTSKCKEKDDLIELIFVYFGGNRTYNRQTSEQERFVEQLSERMRLEQENEQQSNNQNTAQNGTTNQPSQNETQNRPSANQPNPTNTAPNVGPTDRGTRDNGPGSSSSGLDLNQERNRRNREDEIRAAEARLAQEEENETQPSRPDNPNLKLSDIKSLEEIDDLNIKSLKRVLLNNFVDYKGCCERWELQERLKRLWIDNENNRKRAEEILKESDNPVSVSSTTGGTSEDDICKICMDAAIDCVLLECGHMVTCTQCGKRLSECPICRQFVVRAVHTFRS